MALDFLTTPSLYTPLHTTRQEIRLLKILPGRSASEMCCKLETHSLQDYIPIYQEFLSSANQDDDISHQWMQQRLPTTIAQLDSIKRMQSQQPSPALHRYSWGDFATLSYTWGKTSDTRNIIVNDQKVTITANLESALWHCRSRGDFSASFLLWVDALCINQKDMKERDEQVQRMGEIYKTAWSVISWLGEGSRRTDAAVQLLKDFVSFEEAGCLKDIKEELKKYHGFLGRGGWLGLQEMMTREYWGRLWIIQEISMGGKSVLLRIGNAFIYWTKFCKAVNILYEQFWALKDECLYQDYAALKLNVKSWRTVSLHLVQQHLSVASGVSNTQNGTKELSFLQLLEMAVSAKCTDKRDKVYGLLGLMPPQITQVLKPDYTLLPSVVFARTAKAFMEVYKNLEPLREGNPWGKTGCPSWAADWLWLGRGGINVSNSRRMLSYRANGELKGKATFSNNGMLLSCTGFIMDRISGLGPGGKDYFTWDTKTMVAPELYRSIYGDHDGIKEALFRTLLADRGENNQRVMERHAAILSMPSTFRRGNPQFSERRWDGFLRRKRYYYRWEGFREAARKFPLGNCLFDDFFSDTLPEDAEEKDYEDAWNYFDRASKKRRFMTTEKGYIGWAPDNIVGNALERTRKGDLVAIIFGCSMPIVIRPCGNQFQVLGEAYVQGLMNGEAVDGLSQGVYKRRTFDFC